jgi:3-hydroxyacyl-[acyl-carrier-protein] dehydratase
MEISDIIKKLPYGYPFLFVDTLERVDEDGAEGTFVFRDDLPFYKGHFKDSPVTPGVLLTECCAQIGLVCLGIYLLETADTNADTDLQIAMSSSEMSFFKAIFPNEKVRVRSEKVYFRFLKLKCKVSMYNSEDELVCSGFISGMLKK